MDRVPRNHSGPNTSMDVNKTKESNNPDSSDETEDTDEDEEEDHKTSSQPGESNDFDSSDETEDTDEDEEEDHKTSSQAEDRWRERSSSSSENDDRRRVHLLSSIKDYKEEEQITKTCREDMISDSEELYLSGRSEDGKTPKKERKIRTYLTSGRKKSIDLVKHSVLKVNNHDVGSAAILDSGCAGSLMGFDFLDDYVKRLSKE